jgi:hypothetical protein
MASLNGLVAIVSKLRAERTTLLNQLKNVDTALSVLARLHGGSSSAGKRMSSSQKAKRDSDRSAYEGSGL